MVSLRLARWWLAVPALLALAWYWPVLAHGWRSDDFLAVYYYDRDAAAVHWSRVAEEWLRPWFGVRDLYRPLVSLSYGVNWWCSAQPWGFHLLNLLLLAVSAVATAAVAARLAPAAPRCAGCIAGALVVLHPAAVEPTAWIAARTTGLQVACSGVAMLTFLRWRAGHGAVGWHLLATALACASKEGAVLLPASLLVLEVLRGGTPRWLAVAPCGALVAAYLVFRRVLLGWFTTAEEGHTWSGRLEAGLGLFQQLLAPPTTAASWSALALAVGVAGLGLAALGAPGQRRWLLALPWTLLLLLPGTTHLQDSGSALAGRFVFDAVPALALWVGVLAVAAGRRPWRLAAALAVVVGAGWAGRAELQVYREQDAAIAAVQQQLLAVTAAVDPAAPVGVVGLPKLPLLQPALWGFLTQRPFAPTDRSVIGLENLLSRDASTPQSFARPVPLHALLAQGAGVAVWHEPSARLVPLPSWSAGEPTAASRWQQSPAAPQQFLPTGLLPATAVAALELELPPTAREYRVQIRGNLDGAFAAPAWAGTIPAALDGGIARLWLDTTTVLPWLVATTLGGGVAGIELWLDGQPPPAGTVVRAHPRLGEPLPLALPPEPVARAGFAAWLQPPSGGADELHLLLPTGCYVMAVDGAEPPALAAGLRQQLDFVCDVLGPCRVHWFFARQSGPGAPPQRSQLGTAIVR
jgi:hypothetical protein